MPIVSTNPNFRFDTDSVVLFQVGENRVLTAETATVIAMDLVCPISLMMNFWRPKVLACHFGDAGYCA